MRRFARRLPPRYRRLLKSGARSLGHGSHQHDHQHHRYSEAELLERAEEFNSAAELHWQGIAADPAGRKHVLNKPLSTVRDTPSILYRLGLLLDALDLGIGHTVLDFGAGSCWLSSHLNKLRCRTIAVDVSPTALELGRELFALDSRHLPEVRADFRPYDGHRLPLDDASVDRIACFDSFHHVPNQQVVLEEFFRVLRDGGRLVLAEPGEGHSHADQSLFETEHCGVLENDLDLPELIERARGIGFGAVFVKPYPDASTFSFDLERYQRLMAGDDGAFALDELRESLRNFFIVSICKGAEIRDSRNPKELLASIAPQLAGPLRGRAGDKLRFEARVTNRGDTRWLHVVDDLGGYVTLGGHLLDSEGKTQVRGYLRAALPSAVAPGEQVTVPVELPLPARLGRFGLKLDMVDEFVAWFEQCGSPTVDLTLEVEGWPDTREPHQLEARLRLDAATRIPPQTPGAPLSVRLEVANQGDTRWLGGATPAAGRVALGVQLWSAEGALLDRDYARTPLSEDLDPGQQRSLECRFPAPPERGRFQFRFDLVAEQVCWFEQYGSTPATLDVETTDATPTSDAPGTLRARLEAPGASRLAARPGAALQLAVAATNTGNTLWLSGAKQRGRVFVGLHILDAAGTALSFDHARAALPADVAPGGRAEARLEFQAPAAPGAYQVEIDLVDEEIRWFTPAGTASLRVPLDVS